MDPNQLPQPQQIAKPMTTLDNFQNPASVDQIPDTPTATNSLYAQSYDASSVNKIVKTYMTLNKLVFWIGMYVLLFIIAIIIVWRLTLPDTSISFPMRSEDIITQEDVLKENSIGISEKDSVAHDIAIIVKQGMLTLQWNAFVSVNNLVTYKWFTLPQKTSLTLSSSTGDLQQSSHFVSRSHTIQELDQYLKTIVFDNYVSSPTITSTVAQNILLSTKHPLIQYFGIQCLLYPRVGNLPCDIVANQTLPKIAIYNLSMHYDEILTLSKRLQGTNHEIIFCDTIKQYLFLSNDTHASIKEVMTRCGEKYENLFNEFSSFRTIQDQLSKQSIQSNVTTSAVLNSYKLVSVMQEIYHEITKWNNINDLRIGSYVDYVRSLLKSPQYIQWFYMDVIARYNNTFLSPTLTKNSVVARGEEASVYRRLLLELNELNEWSVSKGFTWLNSLISNSELLSSSGSSYTGEDIVVQLTPLERFNQNYSFANYIIVDSKENENQTLSVSGRLRFDTDVWLANNTPLNIVFIYKDQRFYAQSINMSRHPLLTLSINPKLSIQPLSISELYDLIIQTQKTLSGVKPSQSVCTAFEKDSTMKSCSTQQVRFVKKDVTYVFIYDALQGVTNYTISDKNIETSAKQNYGSTITLTKDPVEAIKIILNHTAPAVQATTWSDIVWWAQEVQIQKHFDEIWSTINNITKSQTNYVIDFTVKWYKLTSVYDPVQQSIIGLWIILDKTTYPIRNFKFAFLTASLSDKELFKNDLRTFLLQYDPLTVRRLQIK